MAVTILTIGAGVIGLTVAKRLQDLYPELPHILVAADFPSQSTSHPPSYASMWAGAHVRPIPASTPQLKDEARWLKFTTARFNAILKEQPDIGITKVESIELFQTPSKPYRQQTKENFEEETGLSGFRFLTDLPETLELGYRYDSFCINSPKYCESLLAQFREAGGKVVEKRIDSPWDVCRLAKGPAIVLNASGTGFQDVKYFPTRGQTVKTTLQTKPVTVTRHNNDGTFSFIIPRFFNGGTIVGGTRQPNDTTAEPDMATRKTLLAGGAELTHYACDQPYAAETIEVIHDVVGFRPTREGGMRIELEKANSGEMAGNSLVHAYGAGGRGYEISWGVAEEVAEIVKMALDG